MLKLCRRGHLAPRTAKRECTECVKTVAAAYRAENRDRISAYRKAWGRRNPDKLREYSAREQGLPEPAYPPTDSCECCGVSALALGKRLALDHDHITGKFRGWLCDTCNMSIGQLGDSLDGVLRAVAYLKKRVQN